MAASDRHRAEIESDIWLWLLTLFPSTFTDRDGQLITPAQEHRDFWEWKERIQLGIPPEAWIGIWPRGRAKSTSAELAAINIGVTGLRPYIWYISETQKQSDLHVEAIGEKLEEPTFADFYPEHAEKKIGKFGTQRAWRQSRLTTAGGMTIESVGLDTAARGMKVGDERPGLLIFDDVDGRHDTPATTAKKAQTIAETLIPAGSRDRVIIFIQNMIHPRSIAASLAGKHENADGIAGISEDFLNRRQLSYVEAIEGLVYEKTEAGEYAIIAGEPTWSGQSLEWAENEINTIGPTSFLGEYNHDVEPPAGKVFSHLDWQDIRTAEPIDEILDRAVNVEVWVDPAVSTTDQSDAFAIIVSAVDAAKILTHLYAWEDVTTPEDAMARAMVAALEYQATSVGIETDQGGDTWRSVWKIAREALIAGKSKHSARAAATGAGWKRRLRRLGIKDAKAGSGHGPKTARISQLVTPYETGLIRHATVPTVRTLERALYRFPGVPIDLADVGYWAWHYGTQQPTAAALPPSDEPDEDPYAAKRRSTIFGEKEPARRRR